MVPTALSDIGELSLRSLGKLEQTASINRVPSEFVVVALTAIAESYVDTILRAHIDRTAYRAHPFTKRMYDELQNSIFNSWPSRLDWLGRAFGTTISGTTEAQRFESLRELRNAIIHGAGTLTGRQGAALTELVDLEQRLLKDLAVTVERREFQTSARTSRFAFAITRAYITRLDRAYSESIASKR